MTVDIKELQELLKQKETLIDRLKKLEEKKKEVKEKIYVKIRADYQIQLESLQENVFKKSVSLKNELSQLRTQQQEIKDKYTVVKDEIDELNVRHELGEYNNEEEYKRIVSTEDEKLKNFDHKLQMINERINLYSSMIEKSEDSGGFIQKEEVLEEQEVPIESDLDEIPSEDLAPVEAVTSVEEIPEEIIEVTYCSRCGAENPIDAKNCKECGSDLEEGPSIVCPSCGAINDMDAKNCKECGSDLADDVFETIECPECGAKNSFDQTNCTECGAELIPIDDI
ncbi:MAG: zinc ribbon domain-containing protein [Candidatus Coatesbacteria bacterium]|nr:zinc ribbon domain-containing protein [Candidatus Coatesbacteria bacterium]